MDVIRIVIDLRRRGKEGGWWFNRDRRSYSDRDRRD